MAQQCYMIVSPSPLNSVGIQDAEGHRRWYVKFGDGDPETPSRYAVHNPDYDYEANFTARVAKSLQTAVLKNRGFKTKTGQATEWYIVWERPTLPSPVGRLLADVLDQFSGFNLVPGRNPPNQASAIQSLINAIPSICANPPPNLMQGGGVVTSEIEKGEGKKE
ncbi:hypothetical protein T439DRAFT_362995 [Meredithblackwellia eburnea MCA 4105]